MFQLRKFLVFSVLLPSYFVQTQVVNLALTKTTKSTQYTTHKPSFAVDGNLSQVSTNCGHTVFDTKQTVAYWQVDLTHTAEIINITIYYRQSTSTFIAVRRLNGFQITVGMDNVWQDEQACYSDTEPGYPPNITTIDTCTGPGRYVTIFNYQYDDKDSSYGPILELCEVQVFGCTPNKYGIECKLDCHCKEKGCYRGDGRCFVSGCEAGWFGASCNKMCDGKTYGQGCGSTCYCQDGTCNHITGVCVIQGCQAGWNGPTCSTPCDTSQNKFGRDCNYTCHCQQGSCNRTNGVCGTLGCKAGWEGLSCSTQCKTDKFGQDCKFTCHCLNGSCPRETGKCNGDCEPGWLSETCSQPCDVNKFGLGCANTCNCQNGTCNHITGVCVIQGCQAGWNGPTCSTPCDTSQNKFGRDCNYTCHCLQGLCERKNGVCGTPGCKAGWEGPSCSTPCVINTFGEGCENTCHCKQGTCNNTDGRCFTQGCKPGWKGSSCDTSCDNGTFGADCQSKCYCSSDTCDSENGICEPLGCKEGWTGDTCSENATKEKVQQGGDGTPPSGPGIGIAVGVVVAVIVIAAVVIVIFVFRRRRGSIKGKRKPNKYDASTIRNGDATDAKVEVSEIDVVVDDEGPRNRQSTSEDPIEYENVGSVEYVEPRKVTTYTIKDLKAKLSKANIKEDLGKEYKNIKDDPTIASVVGEKAENKDKNRFRAIYPYDHSRVVLNTLPGVPNSDYINANYIDGVNHREKSIYVAAQGPKTNTVIDFWRMIWQIKSGIIVMLTNPMEKGKVKCFKYWPDVSKVQVHGDLKIGLESEVDSLYFTNRQLKVTHQTTGEIRYIHHLHFTTWPDHGTPDPTQLVLFHRSYMQTKSDLMGPPVVHCSAGIGRTGTFIALDALYRYGKEHDLVDIFEYVKVMRKNRMTMVQTKEQYVFVYEALLESFEFQETSLSKDEFIQFGNQDKRIKAEFTKLVKNIPKYDKSAYNGGNEKYNVPKNRRQSLLPVDKFRPYLMSQDSLRSNYINAVIVPSYKEHTGYLVTQFPLVDTVVDFWCLVYDHESPTIVTLDCSSENEKKINWLPTDADSSDLQIGKMTLRKTADSKVNGETKETELIIVNEDNERSVKVFEVQGWRQGEASPSSGHVLLNLIEMVELWKTTLTDGPITVVCMDGAKCCGLFCGLYTLFQKIRYEDSIDIYQTVKQLQVRRPEFFSSIEQYQFFYNVVREYVENANIYVN